MERGEAEIESVEVWGTCNGNKSEVGGAIGSGGFEEKVDIDVSLVRLPGMLISSIDCSSG